MKIKNALVTLGLALTLGLGVGAGLSAKNNSEVKEAKANATGNITIDMNASGIWANDWKCNLTVYFFDDSSNVAWADLVYADTGTTFASIPYDLTFTPTTMIAVRESDSATTPGFDGHWNQTGNIPYVENGNIIITSNTDGTDTATSYAYIGSSKASPSWGNKQNLTSVYVENGKLYYEYDVSLVATEEFKVVYRGGWYGAFTTSTAASGKFTGGGSNNIVCSSADTYTIKFNATDKSSYISLASEGGGTTYDVTKLGVYDGVLDSQNPLGSDTVPEDSTYAKPADLYKYGYYFDGWYEDQGCNTEYSAKTVTSDMTIYAKYTSWTDYIYYISGSETPYFTYVYYFVGDTNIGYSWPGYSLADYATEVSGLGILKFEGTSQYIYKIPAPTSHSYKMIINNNSNQTYDISASAGAGYYCWLTEGESKYSYSANADAGAAIDFLVDAEAKRNAVGSSTGILPYSICGISVPDATTLYNRYIKLGNAKAYVDRSATNTYLGEYDGHNVPSEGTVSYADIMIQLGKRAGLIESGTSRILLDVVMNGKNTSVVITTVIISIVSIAAVGGYFLLRRRKED